MATYKVNFLHRGEWWVGWSDDVPGALTQGRTLEEARDNLRDAIAMMLEPVDVERVARSQDDEGQVVREMMEL